MLIIEMILSDIILIVEDVIDEGYLLREDIIKRFIEFTRLPIIYTIS